jgi:hypothetical protein
MRDRVVSYVKLVMNYTLRRLGAKVQQWNDQVIAEFTKRTELATSESTK